MFVFRTSGRKPARVYHPHADVSTSAPVARLEGRRWTCYFSRANTFCATPLIASVGSPLFRSWMEKNVVPLST